MLIATIIILIAATVGAYVFGRMKAGGWENKKIRLTARPGHYGMYTLIKTTFPAWILLMLVLLLKTTRLFDTPGVAVLAGCALLMAIGAIMANKQLSPLYNARIVVERHIRYLLIASSLISILTTVGIVLSILFEAIRFFSDVNLFHFLTGTSWNPDTAFLHGAGREGEMAAEPEFGSVPIFAGTFMITIIALCVAVPVGLYAAIYLSEYANTRIRKTFKPILEILAGIPTVVYGFFAALTVSPLVVEAAEFFGLEADYTNALAPGIVMGIMIIPFVSSLSDDVISSVPQSLREGGLALGTTRSETIKRIILPAALPGIISAILLAISRAVGETMIVVMAAGLRPNLTWNPLEGMTTVTVRIVDALTGDQEFSSLETLSAFGLGLVLLVFTLCLNLVSTIIIRKYRQIYE
ncbi:phosphate ABC transporter permease subunit PstC [Limisalsivibrio acetivorans]|uniref:phosphate ABC transporter permease subunit PstC n=1 Tax=Limisalsivibrio acetivorans TaxID=1304888 RepID=UPI0003B434AC|nr:phosphate ABC transporter permease subunit PstC [Limisalsivibrio acetivorans]